MLQAVTRNAVDVFNEAGNIAIAEVCEILDCGLISDVVGDDSSGPLAIFIGKGTCAGLHGFAATPMCASVSELEAFCAKNIKQYRGVDIDRDGIPERWFWEMNREGRRVSAMVMKQVSDDRYESTCGCVLARDYGLTPNGNPMNGRWVIRNQSGELLDFDRYRQDLAERNDIKLC